MLLNGNFSRCPSANTMEITGNNANSELNWETFDIGKDATVKFNGDGKNYLNLINDSKMSEIYGTIDGGSNNIYLVNPNGVLFGLGSVVSANNFYVSTRQIDEAAANAFDGTPASINIGTDADVVGDIVDMGALKASNVILEGDSISLTANIDSLEGTNYSDLKLNAKSDIKIGYVDTSFMSGAEAASKSEGINDSQFSSDAQLNTERDTFGAMVTATYLVNGAAKNLAALTPYWLVRNAYEMQNVQNNLGAHYLLADNIDLSTVCGEGIGNWTPIGKGVTYDADWDEIPATPFTGVFDGQKFQVKNLYINTPDSNDVGLFGYVTSNGNAEGEILDVGLVNCYIYGGRMVGGLVGEIKSGIVRGYNASGTIYGSDQVGGLVGKASNNTIIKGYNKSNLYVGQDAAGNFLGGLVGRVMGGGVNIVGYNEGNITALQSETYGLDAGGLIGGIGDYSDDGNIYEISGYNKGNIIGGIARSFEVIGGLVGNIEVGNSTLVVNGYNTGNLNGGILDGTNGHKEFASYSIGGLVGELNNSTNITINGYNIGSITKANVVLGQANAGGLVGLIDVSDLVEVEEDSVIVLNGQDVSNSSLDVMGKVKINESGPELPNPTINVWKDDITADSFNSLDTGVYGADRLNWDISADVIGNSVWAINDGKSLPFLRIYPDLVVTSPPAPAPTQDLGISDLLRNDASTNTSIFQLMQKATGNISLNPEGTITYSYENLGLSEESRSRLRKLLA